MNWNWVSVRIHKPLFIVIRVTLLIDWFRLEETETDSNEYTNSLSVINDENAMDIAESPPQSRLLATGFYVFDCTDPQCTN